jgi:hypothetical protein
MKTYCGSNLLAGNRRPEFKPSFLTLPALSAETRSDLHMTSFATLEIAGALPGLADVG